MKRKEMINQLVELNKKDLASIISEVKEINLEIKRGKATKARDAKQKVLDNKFNNADPFTLVTFTKNKSKVKLRYFHRGNSGSSHRNSSESGKRVDFSFKFKLGANKFSADLYVTIQTEDADDGERYGYPASCNQYLLINDKEVHDSDTRSEDRLNYTTCYDFLLEAGIPQSEIDKVIEELPRDMDDYLIN